MVPLKTREVKVSQPKYSGPKISHQSNLAPIENQGSKLNVELSKLWFGHSCISLQLLNTNWISDLNDVQFLGYIILVYKKNSSTAFPFRI